MEGGVLLGLKVDGVSTTITVPVTWNWAPESHCILLACLFVINVFKCV